MKKSIIVLTTFLFSIANAVSIQPDMSLNIQGIDVRNKIDRYELSIGEENVVLEKREYKLFKLKGGKKELIAQGLAVYSGADLDNDTEAIYKGEKAHIKIGRLTNEKNPKQIVVIKLTAENKTIAFELRR